MCPPCSCNAMDEGSPSIPSSRVLILKFAEYIGQPNRRRIDRAAVL